MLTFPKANSKIRKATKARRVQARRAFIRAFNHSLEAIENCPGASACVKFCYAKEGRYRLQTQGYRANKDKIESFAGAIIEAVESLPQGAWLRIHAAGDFYDAAYIDKWHVALSIRPDVKAWAYTRSWRIASLLPALERLRALPNVQLFASTDDSIPEPTPTGWRIADVLGNQEHSRQGYLTCPEQTGAMSDCVDCGFCVIASKGNVAFMAH